MRAYPECIPCLINQGLNAVKKLNLPKEKSMEIAQKSLKFLSSFDRFDRSPAYYAYFIQQIVKEITGEDDPFREYKKLANKKAEEIYPELLKEIEKSEDELYLALKVSAVGNAIDFAIKGDFDLQKELNKLLLKDFLVNDYEVFRKKLENAKSVFVIGDNAGEIVLDKLLVSVLKKLGKEVVYGVRGKPILNDATYEDALEVSMTKLCRVVDNGNDKVGTWLEDCKKEFVDIFYSSDIVISKGQANFETLSDADRDIFFLLVAKCNPIGNETGGKKGELILKYKDG
ncbi:damage-control phosphatase ARMT1 family protein [Aquifex sp.]